MVASQTVFGLSIAELAIIVAGIGYVVSLVKDWRPVRQLRQENGELRNALKLAQSRIDDLETKVSDLEKTSVPVLQSELVEVARVLERVVQKLEGLDGSVRANTAAVEILSKRRVIDEALDDHDERGAAA